MLSFIARKIFGTKNDKEIKKYYKRVAKINALESKYEALSDDELRGEFITLQSSLIDGKVTKDSILNDVFAIVREVSKRTLNMRHFDVQLIGGMVLNEGKIAETTSVSTSFRKGKSKLPDLSVLEEYQPISSEILLTENDIHTNKYGVWMCAYNIRPSVAEKTLSQGDASVWYSR